MKPNRSGFHFYRKLVHIQSKNYSVDQPLPVWLKLVRHGNRFSGYYSLDGKSRIISHESGEIPGLAKTMDIGLAGGANDQKFPG